VLCEMQIEHGMRLTAGHQGHTVDVLASRGDEGRRNLRKAQRSW
jgi:hypothetical protein